MLPWVLAIAHSVYGHASSSVPTKGATSRAAVAARVRGRNIARTPESIRGIGPSEPTRAREIQMDTMAMMKSMDMGEMTMDMDAMQECMQSLNACAMAAAMCAGSDMMHGPEMATCCAMCSNMVEMAQATMHMMMRPAGMNMDVMSAMMTACMTMGKACAAECRAHADMDEMCATARWPATTWS